jgi:ATP-dependent DNA helicase RecG
MTGAQNRAIDEITSDQAKPKRMLRMLQGDVGSGKTLVALWAMLNAMEAGAQAALLAPTEVLARQHHASIQAMLAPLDIEIGLLLGQGRGTANAKTGTTTMPVLSRKDTLEKLADGSLSLVVGTHALLSETVAVSRSWLGGC